MSFQTVRISSWEEYLTDGGETPDYIEEATEVRGQRLLRFPHAIMLQVSFPELDFANRWCWQNFGPRYGECHQSGCIYPVCTRPEPHSHLGKWSSDFLVKTDYDFGFCEWYFVERSDYEMFVAFIDQINWGENFPR